MKQIVVFGVGRMGTAISYAMKKLGYYVIGVDANPESANDFRKHINSEDGIFYTCDERDYNELLVQYNKPEVVISSLPYHQTQSLAEFCIDNNLRYCDLGGRVDVSENINNYAKEKATKPVMTDLGLAPGWVNIVAEQGYSKIHQQVDDVEMMVGGLPCCFDANPPFNYACTWSVDGLINEYKDDCEVLIDGEIIKEQGMEGQQDVELKLLNETLEAFYTSGGASHTIQTMKDRGVKNCFYKTLRYKGHCDAVRFLLRHAKLDDDTMERIFVKGCPPQPFGDLVLIYVHVKGGDVEFNKEIVVPYREHFSAMQVATAFPISSVASIMAEGYFDNRVQQNRGGDIKLPLNLVYKDIPFDKFNDNLKTLDIRTA